MSYVATIDAGACATHGDCEAIAPEVFAIEDVAVVVGTGTGPDELMLAAAQACPSVAIVITDADGRPVFP